MNWKAKCNDYIYIYSFNTINHKGALRNTALRSQRQFMGYKKRGTSITDASYND